MTASDRGNQAYQTACRPCQSRSGVRSANDVMQSGQPPPPTLESVGQLIQYNGLPDCRIVLH